MRAYVSCLLFALVAALPIPISAVADDSTWMEDNLYRFRNNDLTTLSIPASHDAGMYRHDIDKLEIGVENLRAQLSLSGPLVPDVSFGFSETGVIEAGDLLALFDALMRVAHEVDKQCITIPLILEVCTTFGIEETVWNWVSEYYEFATGKPGDLSITQNLDLYGQLSSGARRFDLRPKKQGGALYIHHSDANIKGVGGALEYELPLGIDVPCVDRLWPLSGCVTGTDRYYEIGTFEFLGGGEIKSVSATGPSISEVLTDVRRFMEEGRREFVILNFSAYWKGYRGKGFDENDYDDLIQAIDTNLAPWLLTEEVLAKGGNLDVNQRLLNARLPDLIGQHGHVLANFEVAPGYPFVYTDPGTGLWPADAVSGYGGYSNKDNLEAMVNDQRTNWNNADSDRFELWWTLTCQPGNLDCAVRDLAVEANPELPDFIDSLAIPNANGNNINEIWVDFLEETAATEIAIRLNPIAATIDIKPGNNRNIVNPRLKGGIWVAILADPEGLTDLLQIDLPTITFGPERSKAIRHPGN